MLVWLVALLVFASFKESVSKCDVYAAAGADEPGPCGSFDKPCASLSKAVSLTPPEGTLCLFRSLDPITCTSSDFNSSFCVVVNKSISIVASNNSCHPCESKLAKLVLVPYSRLTFCSPTHS